MLITPMCLQVWGYLLDWTIGLTFNPILRTHVHVLAWCHDTALLLSHVIDLFMGMDWARLTKECVCAKYIQRAISVRATVVQISKLERLRQDSK